MTTKTEPTKKIKPMNVERRLKSRVGDLLEEFMRKTRKAKFSEQRDLFVDLLLYAPITKIERIVKSVKVVNRHIVY